MAPPPFDGAAAVTAPLLLGAVAYDPKVVTIWDGFRRWFAAHGLPFDYVLYSNYERQVKDLVDGRIDVAWNSPLAWVRTRRLDRSARAVAMRDTDRDLTSVIVVRSDSDVTSPPQLGGRVVGSGAIDSPQGTLLPLALLDGVDVTVRRFEVGVGLHGDHVGGERDAARALADGEVDAACMIDGNHLLFTNEGTLPTNGTRVIAQTPPYDHCNFSVVGPGSPLVDRFVGLLLAMDYADPAVRPLLDLEGLTRWLPGRTSGYQQLEVAVDHFGFYDSDGEVTADGYRP
ncbi:MAG TPA: PhnD/SsuA/transferrin family substrate-binding protein [Acidimicrobiales bacterium]|jgi:ABC-type phosphate/phosphonate transport system substrate-binding protein|nr:PhnD/SsuA/transferrin family substrate-binding protein [Acidimicrobiales bacterium]